MKAQIDLRLGATDRASVTTPDGCEHRSLDLRPDGAALRFGIGQLLAEAAARGLRLPEIAVDMLVTAVAVQAADTRISRVRNAQDSFTREIVLIVPVSDPDLWGAVKGLIERMLRFLSGDLWQVDFRPRPEGLERLATAPSGLPFVEFDRVALFSGGVDSFVGAVDLLTKPGEPLFVSHYWDMGTSSQSPCAEVLGERFHGFGQRHVRARVGITATGMTSLGSEDTQRARSFLFLSLAAACSGALSPGDRIIEVPENGLISLNVPLDPLRLGAWSTRTTHPFYLARWQELVRALGLAERIENRYRFRTKGQMLDEVAERSFVRDALPGTISCSSIAKARWIGQSPGHCGYCVPCLIRRAAEIKAYGREVTPYVGLSSLDHDVDPRSAKGENVRSFELMVERLRRRPASAATLVRIPGPLDDYDLEEVGRYRDVFREGIGEVGVALSSVHAVAG